MAKAGTVEVDVKANVAPLVGAVRGAVDGLSKALGLNLGVDASGFTGGIRSAAASAERELASVAGAGAAVGRSLMQVGTVTAAAGVAGIIGLKGLADSYEAAGKETLKLQRLTGGTAEDMSRLRFVAQQSGLSFDQLTTSIVRLSRSSQGGGASALESLGVQMRDGAGKSRDYVAVLGDLATKFQAMPNGIEKNALAVQLFGRRGADLIPILNRGAEGMAELAAKSDEFGATMSKRDTDAIKDEIKDQREFAAAIASLKTQIGREVFPVLDQLEDVVTHTVAGFAKLPGPVKAFAGTLATVSVGAAVAGGALSLVGAGIGALSAMAARAGAAMSSLVPSHTAAAASASALEAASASAAVGISAEGTAAAGAATALEGFTAANASAAVATRAAGSSAAASSIANVGTAAAASTGMLSRFGGLLSSTVGKLGLAAVAFAGFSYAVRENSRQREQGITDSIRSAEALKDALDSKYVAEFGGNVLQVADNIAELNQVGALNAKQKIFGFDEMANRADVAAAQIEALKEVLAQVSPEQGRRLLDGLRDALVQTGMPTDQVKEKLEDLYALLGQDDPFGPAVAGLEGLNGALTDASQGMQGLVSAVQSATEPFLSLAGANLDLEDAQDAVSDAQRKYTEIVQRNTSAIRSARQAVMDAAKALADARKNAGPGSDAADSAEDAVSRAQDALLQIRTKQAEQFRDERQRQRDMAAGKQVTEGIFGKDFTADLQRADRELDKARQKRDDILAGRSDQVTSATQRLAVAESQLNTELAAAGPSSDAARRAQNDLHQAQIAATRSAEAQQAAQAAVTDTLAAYPGIAGSAIGYLEQLNESGLISQSTFAAVATSVFAASVAYAALATNAGAAATAISGIPGVGNVAGLGVGGTAGGLSIADRYSGVTAPTPKSSAPALKPAPALEPVPDGAPGWPIPTANGQRYDNGHGVIYVWNAKKKVWEPFTKPKSYAVGGYIDRAQLAQLHANELVLPLSDVTRTNQLLDSAGITNNNARSFNVTLNQTVVGADPGRTADATIRGVRAASWSAMAKAGAL